MPQSRQVISLIRVYVIHFWKLIIQQNISPVFIAESIITFLATRLMQYVIFF